MIDVATLSVIRRWALREQMPIREIARRTGLSRNTIRRYLRSGDVTPRYPDRRRASNLDAFAEKLRGWLHSEARQSRKQRRTLKQMHRDLVALGYAGSYSRVAAFGRAWRAQQLTLQQSAGKAVFVPLSFAPGEAFQFDWSEDSVVIRGERIKLQVAHTKLSFSRAFVLRAYLLQTHEMLFDAHNHALRVFEGVPRRGIYDNMKTAVDKLKRGKVREINKRFTAMTSHYVYEADFCNPAAGWEKGQVEKNVRDARHRLWQQAPEFLTLGAVNDWLEVRCKALWREIPHALHGTVHDAWRVECAHLMALPRAFDGFIELPKRVSPTCLVHFERNRYSVPASYANRPVSLRVYAERLVFAAEGQILCEHPRCICRNHQTPGQTFYDWRHYLAVVQRKPGALRNGAPFAELPTPFKRLQAEFMRRPGGDREMVEVLALVLQHEEQAVLAAVELALDAGVPTKTHVLNVLHRLLDGTPLTQIHAEVSTALQLTQEPQANVLRYDALRLARPIKERRHVS